MTIQEAQEYSREHGLTTCNTGDIIPIDVTCYRAIAEIEYALDNGYQLCKVDEVIDNIEQARQYKGLTNIEIIDSHNIGLDKYFDLGLDKAITIIKKACEG